MRIHPLIIAGIAVISSFAWMASARANSMSARDFVRNASIANEFSIESSKLALEKSQNKEIKNFAHHIIDNEEKAGDKLANILQHSNPQLQPAKELDDRHQKLIEQLQSASLDDFNRQYIKSQADVHKEETDFFKSYSRHGEDPVLKDFAEQMLPTLKDHLAQAQNLKLD